MTWTMVIWNTDGEMIRVKERRRKENLKRNEKRVSLKKGV
jgi:hypothetical protein